MPSKKFLNNQYHDRNDRYDFVNLYYYLKEKKQTILIFYEPDFNHIFKNIINVKFS